MFFRSRAEKIKGLILGGVSGGMWLQNQKYFDIINTIFTVNYNAFWA